MLALLACPKSHHALSTADREGEVNVTVRQTGAGLWTRFRECHWRRRAQNRVGSAGLRLCHCVPDALFQTQQRPGTSVMMAAGRRSRPQPEPPTKRACASANAKIGPECASEASSGRDVGEQSSVSLEAIRVPDDPRCAGVSCETRKLSVLLLG